MMICFWFAAACCVIAGGIIGFVDILLTEFVPLDLIEEIYLFGFGALMFVLDAPCDLKVFIPVKAGIRKYCKFMNRLTGRGIWYIFLGTMSFATLWENKISKFLAVILGVFVFAVGLFTAIFGLCKSGKLEKVRVPVSQNRASGKLESLYKNFAKTAPELGLMPTEFNDMAQQLKGVTFDSDELFLVFNALAGGQFGREDNISYQSLDWWCSSGMTLL